jgi:hypothetical protein
LIPFPAARGELRLRRFGERASDLELDISGDDPSAIVTVLLAACAVGPDGARVDRDVLGVLPLGDRLAALLALVASVDDRPLLATIRCTSCDEVLEAPLLAGELLAYHARAVGEGTVWVAVGPDHEILARLPTLRDLERWRADGATMEQMAADLIIDDRTAALPPAWVETIEHALGEADLLVNFRLSAECPSCGEKGSHELDLQALALRRLQAARRELLSTVHRLASVYHWSEEKIMAVPPARRRLYLRMIEDER